MFFYALRLRLAPALVELACLCPIFFKSAAAPVGNAPALLTLRLNTGSAGVRPRRRTIVAFQRVAKRRPSGGVVMVAGLAATVARWHRLLSAGAAHDLPSQGGMFLHDRAPFKLVWTQVTRAFRKRESHGIIGVVVSEFLQQVGGRREFAQLRFRIGHWRLEITQAAVNGCTT